MNNFSDTTVIRNNANITVTASSGYLYINDNLYDNSMTLPLLLQPFRIRVHLAHTDLKIWIDQIEIYPAFKHKTLDIVYTDTDVVVNITRPFYSWRHVVTGRGWLLYDHSTYC
jgi:hypothetical protein